MQLTGKTMDAFLMFSLPPEDLPDDALARETRIRQKSRQNYVQMSKADVLKWLIDKNKPNTDANDDDKPDDEPPQASFVVKS